MRLNITVKQSLLAGLAINLLALVAFGLIAVQSISTLNGNQQELSLSTRFETQGRNISQAVGSVMAHNSRRLSADRAEELEALAGSPEVALFEQALAEDRAIVASLQLEPPRRATLEGQLDQLEQGFERFKTQSDQLHRQWRDILVLQQQMPLAIAEIDTRTDEAISQIELLTDDLRHLVTRQGRQFARSVRNLNNLERAALDELRAGFQEIVFGNEPKARTESEQVRSDIVKLTALSRRILLVQDPEQLVALRDEALLPLSANLNARLEHLVTLLHQQPQMQQKAQALATLYGAIMERIIGSDNALYAIKSRQLAESAALRQLNDQLDHSRNDVLSTLAQLSASAQQIVTEVQASSARTQSRAGLILLLGGGVIAC